MDELELVPLCRAFLKVEEVLVLENTPNGTMMIGELVDSVWEGERFTLRQRGRAAADWMLQAPDATALPDVRLTLESDRGAFAPRGFTVKADDDVVARIARFAYLLEPMDAADIRAGYGGVDIDPLSRDFGIPTIGLAVDSYRYFDYHHSDRDIFENVHERELKLGAAALTSMVYLLDRLDYDSID